MFDPSSPALILEVKSVGFAGHDVVVSPHFNIVIECVWVVCVGCILGPICVFVYTSIHAARVTVDITGIPYDCSLFYLGLFVGLPGASVYVFCCTLHYWKNGKFGIFLCMASVFLFMCSVERACSTHRDPDTSPDFYILSASALAGIASQIAFATVTSMPDERKQWCITLLCLGGVMVLLSITAVAIAGTVFDENYSKASCYITSIPIAVGVCVYVLSTYSTLFAVRQLCETI